MSQVEDTPEYSPPQQEVDLDTANSPSADAKLPSEEDCGIDTTLSAPKRKRRRRKWRGSEHGFEVRLHKVL